MTMRITMTQTRMGESGSLLTAGSTYTVSKEFGAEMVGARGYATDTDGVLSSPKATGLQDMKYDPLTQSAVSGAGSSFLYGPVTSGAWMKVPSLFRLRITGTGTLQMDSKDSQGNITLATFPLTSYTSETDKIEFPYAGDDAVTIRVTLTGTLTCEVI